MKKGTNAYKNETITHFYGIHSDTLEVVHITHSRGGTLTRWHRNGRTSPPHRYQGPKPKAEIHTVFNLTDVKEFPAPMDHTFYGPELKALEELAAQRRADRDAKKA